MRLIIPAYVVLAVVAPSCYAAEEYDFDALFQEAFGGSVKKELPPQLQARLQVNGDDKGSLQVFIDKEAQRSSAAAGELLRLLKGELYPQHIRVLKRSVNGGKISEAALGKIGIKAKFNDQNISLDLEIPNRLKPPVQLNNKKKPIILDNELKKAAGVSGYANIRLGQSWSEYQSGSNKSTNNQLNSQIETALNVKGLVLENRFSFTRTNDTDIWRRNYTRLVWDNPEVLHRYKAGDVNVLGVGYQNTAAIGGVTLSREFSLDPYSDYYSKGEQSFTLDSDSEVQIFSNGVFLRKLKLSAGEYTFNDLRLKEGENKVKLIITDNFGAKKNLFFDHFHSSQLLKVGVSRFALSAGVPRKYDNDGWEYLDSAPLISGYYQKGVSKSLTLGGNLQFNERGVLLGLEGVAPNRWGRINADIALSSDKKRGSGAALKLNYTPPQRSRRDASALRWNLAFDFASSEFSPLVTTPLEEDNVADYQQSNAARLSFNASKRLTKRVRANFSSTYKKQRGEGSDDSLFASVSLSGNITPKASVSTSIRYSKTGNESDSSVYAALNIALDRRKGQRRKTLRGTYDSNSQALKTTLSVSSAGRRNLDSISGNLSWDKYSDKQEFGATANFLHDRFLLHGTLDSNKQDSGNRSTSGQLSLNTAVSFADGAWGVSQPIYNSFAIFSTDARLPKNTPVPIVGSLTSGRSGVYRDSLLPKYYHSVIGQWGNAVVTNMTQQRYQKMEADIRNLPVNSVTHDTSAVILPGYKQGYHVNIGGQLGVIAEGFLLNGKGDKLTMEGGEVTSIYNKSFPKQAFFTNQEGRFRLPVLPKGRYRMTLFNYPEKSLDFNLPAGGKQLTHSLGNLQFK